MNKQSVDLLSPVFQQIFALSVVDETGKKLDSTDAIFNLTKYCCFLEEMIYLYVPDELAGHILKHINVVGTQDATDEANVHDDEDEPGSFY